jgi:hypothetical protein
MDFTSMMILGFDITFPIKTDIMVFCLPFSPTNGNDQVNTSIKFGNQYGWGEQLNCLMFITLFSYFKIAAEIRYEIQMLCVNIGKNDFQMLPIWTKGQPGYACSLTSG